MNSGICLEIGSKFVFHIWKTQQEIVCVRRFHNYSKNYQTIQARAGVWLEYDII